MRFRRGSMGDRRRRAAFGRGMLGRTVLDCVRGDLVLHGAMLGLLPYGARLGLMRGDTVLRRVLYDAMFRRGTRRFRMTQSRGGSAAPAAGGRPRRRAPCGAMCGLSAPGMRVDARMGAPGNRRDAASAVSKIATSVGTAPIASIVDQVFAFPNEPWPHIEVTRTLRAPIPNVPFPIISGPIPISGNPGITQRRSDGFVFRDGVRRRSGRVRFGVEPDVDLDVLRLRRRRKRRGRGEPEHAREAKRARSRERSARTARTHAGVTLDRD
jgi:hypothetical protein